MFLHSQAELALGSRFKALSESLYAIANATYRDAGIEFDGHWFPVLRYLQVKGPATVTEIAGAIGQTHSAVSQLAARLRRGGWITRRTDRNDARRGMLDLSAEGEKRLGSMGPLWCAIRRGARAAIERCGGPFDAALGAIETDCASGRVAEEIRAEHARLRNARPRIEPYRPEWQPHFYRINAEWLRRYFAIEDVDERVLADPQRHILDPGGAIVFATVDGEVIGTCALLREAPGVYELTKMGVESGWRGLGAGRLLLEATIAEFHKRRGRTLFLESNAILGPALALYESAGFVHHPAPRPGSHYRRADVYMVYEEAGRNSGGVAKRRRA